MDQKATFIRERGGKEMHVAEVECHMANFHIQPHGPSLESCGIQPAQTSTQQQAVPEAPQEEVELDQETADRYLLWLSTARAGNRYWRPTFPWAG